MFSDRLSLFIIFVILLSSSILYAEGVEYDRGQKEGERAYLAAENCVETPCVITQWGAIKIPKKMAKSHRVNLGMIHRGGFRSISLMQESSTLEQKLSQRVFTKSPNRKVVNLERMVETGKTQTIYMFGLLLQYEFDEVDLLALQLTNIKDPSMVKEYFFRYHHTALNWDVDIAFVQPINIFNPNPNDEIQAAYSTAALSFSVARAMDPDKKYSLLSKALRSFRVNIFSGILLRRDIAMINGDRIVADEIDGFGGLGFTFFDFLALGYGGNFFRSPHTTFPFVGIEVRHLMEFLRSMKKDTHSKWQRYLKEEMTRVEN